jgi:uncharacterized protein YuzE
LREKYSTFYGGEIREKQRNKAAKIPEPALQAIPILVEFPQQRFWIDYDREADVLYISFRRVQDADDSIMTDEGFLLRYRQNELVGVTVLNASVRGESKP